MCPWCTNPNGDENTPGVPDLLCRPHVAEHDGLSVAELDRMESEQHAERLDAVGG